MLLNCHLTLHLQHECVIFKVIKVPKRITGRNTITEAVHKSLSYLRIVSSTLVNSNVQNRIRARCEKFLIFDFFLTILRKRKSKNSKKKTTQKH